MTPTEQDKELREALYALLKTDPRADAYVIPYRVMDIFADFIIADRKRVALEARIDELHKALDENKPFGEGQLDIASEYAEYRIAKLKAQKEEV